MAEEHSWDAGSVAKLRYELGMSQDELSKALGVRQQTVSDWETGSHTPKGASAKMLSMVAEARATYDAATPARPKREP
jgi:DNA-binding transcriptional regulator YiaG